MDPHFTKSNCEPPYTGLQLTLSLLQFTSPTSLLYWVFLTPSCASGTLAFLLFFNKHYSLHLLFSLPRIFFCQIATYITSSSLGSHLPARPALTTVFKCATCSSSKTLRRTYTWHLLGIARRHCGCRRKEMSNLLTIVITSW